MPARGIRLQLLVPAAVLALTACGHEPPSVAAKPPSAALATAEVGAAGTTSEVLLDGVVEAVHQATLSAQTAGRVSEAPADVNDHVAKGALLLRLRAAEQVAGLGEAQAGLEAARARDAQARTQHDRIRDMYERQVVARSTYDDAVAARDAAVAGLAGARAALDAAREGVGYTELRAPFDGIVTARPVQVGEAVAPGTPLIAVASLDALRVVAQVPQQLASEVRARPQATVYVNDERIASRSVTVFPSVEPQSSTFPARIDLPPSVAGLAPGMFAKVGFATDESGDANASARLLVPQAAVVERSELRAVYVVSPDGRVALRQVRLGRAAGDTVEVLAGLVRGERIATDPAAAGLAARAPAPATHE